MSPAALVLRSPRVTAGKALGVPNLGSQAAANIEQGIRAIPKAAPLVGPLRTRTRLPGGRHGRGASGKHLLLHGAQLHHHGLRPHRTSAAHRSATQPCAIDSVVTCC